MAVPGIFGGMRILSLSSVYPNPAEPGLGLFVRSRLHAMAKHAEVRVVAPIPLLDYSHPERQILRCRTFPACREDGPVPVHHPHWVFPPYGTPANVLLQFTRLLPLAARLRKTYPFDLIDAHFCYPEGCTASLLAAAFDVPFSVTLRGSETVFHNYRYRRAAMAAALKRASSVITVSEELRQFAISLGSSPERTHSIPNGIDTDLFHLRDPRQTRHALGLPLDRKLLLSAGELIEAKGHHVVVESLCELLARGEDAELLIAGATARGGPRFEDSLRQKVREANLGDRVRFLGWTDRQRMAELLATVDVFCLASYTEGWPNVVNEALACGTPAVVTQVGGVSAMIPSGDYGTIVPQKNQPAFHEAVFQALHRDWDRSMISRWGQSRTWDSVACKVLECFSNALAQRSGAPRATTGRVTGNI
jgi:glycosyltransferase involved in cell wall biosynthesis